MNEAFPKEGNGGACDVDGNSGADDVPLSKDKPYWIRAIEEGQGVRNASGFTTVGKPKMTSKQYNSPLEIYSEEALEEIMNEGTLK